MPTAIDIPASAGAVTTHETTYLHDTVRVFDANMALDLSEDPGVGIVENKGLLAGAQFDVVGSWTRNQTANGGYYWQKNDNNVGGLRHRPLHSHDVATATMNSLNIGSYADTAVITDTANDLQALFGYKGRETAGGIARDFRTYKIAVWTTSAGSFIYGGYIGAVAKNGNQYTMKIYGGPSTSYQYCNRGTGTKGTDFHWKIYDAGLSGHEYDGGGVNYHEGVAFSIWYYPSDATADNVHLIGFFDDWIANAYKLNGPTLRQYSTDYVVRLQTMYDGSSQNQIDTECLANNRWIHLVGSIGAATSDFATVRIYANGALSMNLANSWTYSSGMAGSLSIACQMLFAGSLAHMPSGSRIAYPKFWKKQISGSLAQAVYQYERGLLGV